MSLFVTMKSAARRAIAPFARPIWRRIRPRIVRFTDLLKLSDAWHQLAPSLANAAASVGAVAREQARMKREYDAAFAELRSAIGLSTSSSGAAHILNGENFQRASTGEGKLNLGPMPMAGYVNVGRREMSGVDIVAQVDALPFDQRELGAIHCAHLLEQFTQEELERRLLPYWAGLLKPGGAFSAVVARDAFAAESLPAILRAAGFVDVQVTTSAAADLEVLARAPLK